ncbi:MAG: hypothetical protein FWD39_04160 [Clostridiales bacterium]|nr:hypothetical protein [Clostridiales bacterium]
MDNATPESVTPKQRKKLSPRMKWVLALVLAIVFISAWNAGLGLPSGFTKNTREVGYNIWPIISEHSQGRSLIFEQFEELNAGREKNRLYFSYNNEIYYMENSDGNISVGSIIGTISIYKKTDNTLIGKTLLNTNRTGDRPPNTTRYYFLDDQYIYYINMAYANRYELPLILGTDGFLSVTYNGIVRAPTTYWKDTVYRFNLETGENEKISLGLFIQMINKYDETVMKNPNYKGNLK